MSYLGFLSGVLLAHPLEMKLLDFDPKSSSPFFKTLRVLMTVAAVFVTLALLDIVFARIAPESSALGSALRYVRYATAGLSGMLLAPWLCTRLGLAEAGSAADLDRLVGDV